MSSTKFIAILPQTLQPGDKIRIKGSIANGAEQFSINFVNDTCKAPLNITYHFKWILHDDIIVENYKVNGEWMDHRESVYDAFDGPTFALEFAFQDGSIYVYLVHDDGRNIITRYEPDYEISDIESIQVWGDVEKINELTFSYN